MTLVYLAIAFAVGIAAGDALRSAGLFGCNVPGWVFPALATSLLALLLLLRKQRNAALAAAISLFVVLGMWRYTGDPFEPCWNVQDLAHYQSAAGVWATVEGQVIGFPDVRDTATRYQLAVERVTVDGQGRAVRGRALIEAARNPIYAYGDTLRVTGLLRTPPTSDDFDYRRYLAGRNIHSLIRPRLASQGHIERTASGGGSAFWRGLYALRKGGAAVISRSMPEPAAGLLNGMVLGIEGGISEEVDDAFRATGTTHLIVISGSNIAFLAGALAAALGQFLSRRRAALAAAPLVLAYVLLVGADPPALRAGVMGLLALGAVYFGRRGTAYVALCAAVLVMLALNPLTFWDVGFRLSFAATLGLILLTRPLSRAVRAALRTHLPADATKRWAGVLESTLIVTIAAQVAVLPLMLCYFGRLSPISLLTNVLVLPVQPAILSSGILALLGGALWQPLGQLLGLAPWLFLSYTVGVVRVTAAVPFVAVDTGRISPLFVVGYYALLGGALLYPRIAAGLRRQPEVRRAAGWSTLLLAPVAFAVLGWSVLPDGRAHVVFVPGEGGEAAVIVAPNGRTGWVWDGRGDGAALVAATRRGGWVRGRPDVVLTDCQANPWPDTACVDLGELLAGSEVALADGLSLTRLRADDPALMFSYGKLRMVLPSTLTQEAQKSLEAVGSISVLKAPGPGTGAWPTVQHLRAVQPQLVLWPLETTYPPEVAGYLTTEVNTARIETGAAVEVVSDGDSFWLKRYSAIAQR